MKIQLKEITIRELVEGYADDGERGVTGYGGRLDIRPPYQREFVYKDKQRNAVIDTVMKGYPLNVMYWAVRDDGTFEVIDGQQRTISIADYVIDDFSIKDRFFNNLQNDEREKILNYKLMVYFCEGTDSEKLEWFKTINIAGEKLMDQELRNAVYAGSWTADAKKRFSKDGCVASNVGSKYLRGSVNRQDYLETAIKWINDGDVVGYMADNQHKQNAVELWNHFRSVIDRVETLFPKYRKEMKGVDWGSLDKYMRNESLDPKALETEVKRLMEDSDVQKRSGIYAYVLDGDEKHLNLRAFDDNIKGSVYERQNGRCPKTCPKGLSKKWKIEEMEADHIDPWSKGGRTTEDNCQMLCRECNRRKSSM